MSATAAMIQEFEQEAATTRRVLERVPTDKLAWKPHAKSMSLGALAMHIASGPAFLTDWATKDSVTFTGGSSPDAWRSSATRIHRSVSASRIRSPVDGP